MAEIASSRIFVKGLPPTFTEAEFRKHFAQARDVTDAKIFPNRRIGYVGYKTPEDAQKAVKYFNRTFIRMSRIGVELARPIQDAKSVRQNGLAPTARRASGMVVDVPRENALKRKRDTETMEDADPKLREFLEAYKPKSKRKAWENGDVEMPTEVAREPAQQGTDAIPEGQSDGEYEEVPTKAKRTKRDRNVDQPNVTADTTSLLAAQPEQQADVALDASLEPARDTDEVPAAAVSDADWARSRTSRLLGLLDDAEDDVGTATRQQDDHMSGASDNESEMPTKGLDRPQNDGDATHSMPTPPSDDHEPAAGVLDVEESAVRSSMRLFLRNLPYDVRREDLEAEFAPFGDIEEVSSPGPFLYRLT